MAGGHWAEVTAWLDDFLPLKEGQGDVETVLQRIRYRDSLPPPTASPADLPARTPRAAAARTADRRE